MVVGEIIYVIDTTVVEKPRDEIILPGREERFWVRVHILIHSS